MSRVNTGATALTIKAQNTSSSPLSSGNRPHQCHHPTDESPTEEKVEHKDSYSVVVFSGYSDYGRQKVKNQAEEKENDTEETAEIKIDNRH